VHHRQQRLLGPARHGPQVRIVEILGGVAQKETEGLRVALAQHFAQAGAEIQVGVDPTLRIARSH
jgi:hypothetical protein